MASPTLTHEWQDRLHHRHSTKEVHVELTPHLFERRFLHDALMTITGGINQNVDRSMVLLNILDNAIEHIERRHVENGGPGAVGMQCFECFAVCVMPHGTDNPVPCRDGSTCDRLADAGTRAGDEEILRVGHDSDFQLDLGLRLVRLIPGYSEWPSDGRQSSTRRTTGGI